MEDFKLFEISSMPFEYSSFYQQLVQSLKREFAVSDDALTQAMSELTSIYRRSVCGCLPLQPDFNSIRYCLGYLHRYVAGHATLVKEKLEKCFTQESKNAFTSMLTDARDLNVMVMGSGPGCDVVGFLGALQGVQERLTSVDLVCVDKMEGWSKVIDATLKKLEEGSCDQTGKMFRNVRIRPVFIKEDIIRNTILWSDESEVMFETADVVLVVKVLSNLQEYEKYSALNNIERCMKVNSFVVIIDFPLDVVDKFLRSKENLSLVYEESGRKSSCPSHQLLGHSSIGYSTAAVLIFKKEYEIFPPDL